MYANYKYKIQLIKKKKKNAEPCMYKYLHYIWEIDQFLGNATVLPPERRSAFVGNTLPSESNFALIVDPISEAAWS